MRTELEQFNSKNFLNNTTPGHTGASPVTFQPSADSVRSDSGVYI